MKIETLAVSVKSQNASSVTFDFKVSARLNATDEAAVKWGLWVKILVMGEEKFGNGYVLFQRSQEGYAGTALTPVGKKQGDPWAVDFTHSYQKNTIAMSGEEKGIITTARLVPVTEINPSQTVTHTFVAQI